MPALPIVDHSPYQPSASPPLDNASNLLLIDNYDSFTWNVYQYLCLEGATVTVVRNDEKSLEEIIALNPTQLVLSPGPGHPDTDTGICKDATDHFKGKIPIFGVCMGEQCIYSVFGGQVGSAGEILHGKTSYVKHDSKGVYAGLPQDLLITRYHSLAGMHPTLPECLEVSSWTVKENGERDVIMGVRHREYTIEGVQFHPESILTAEGRTMLRNFLKLQGGTWAENAKAQSTSETNGVLANGDHGQNSGATTSKDKTTSILEKIFQDRKLKVAAQKLIPSQRPADLQAAYDLNVAPPQISFPERLKSSPYNLTLLAEVKRASPSKGIIAIDACAPAQAKEYAMAGASVISVLTEPEWFKGSLEDMRLVRQAFEGMPNRPAVLRKEFIFDEYQILEARLAGADTILLIVKMLDEALLHKLYHYSLSLGMEPLVEVNTVEEMEIAVKLGSKVVGVNNRNLTNFEVDLDTTSRLMSTVPKETIVCALSGISGPKDVEPYLQNGVKAVLVGEALMRAADTGKFIKELLGGSGVSSESNLPPERLVKICGTRTPEAAKAAIEAGADLIGMILVEGRRRLVPENTAVAISQVVQNTLKDRQVFGRANSEAKAATDFFSFTSNHHMSARHRALLVGVFQNQPLEYILKQVKLLDLDIVQLHGQEPLEWARLIPVPVMRRFQPGEIGIGKRGYHSVPLLDAGLVGGTGQQLDIGGLAETFKKDPDLRVMFAGGLDPSNVKGKLQELKEFGANIIGVDVSSGVEENQEQSIAKIQAFIAAVKEVPIV